ncbi:hypothetical protein [Peristeroidobacter agariperforans]|uniref:hypothetical protein n=1 Tax=Peristeroidobacter agariperforans TaxID=268404 RepID=UPI00101DC58B|nr:hypothetical protein [Peristeroidobacter agariperforans]
MRYILLAVTGCLLLSGCGLSRDPVPLRLELPLRELANRTVETPIEIEYRCVYELTLRLHHREGRMREYEALLVNKELPVEMRVELRNEAAQPVLQKSVRAKHFGESPTLSSFAIASTILEPGKYQLTIASGDIPSQLLSALAELVVQQPPKTLCPK